MTAEVRTLIATLTKERARIDRALAALTLLVAEDAPTPKRGRGRAKGAVLSAEHRAHLSAAQKARHARRRAEKAAALTAEPEISHNQHAGAIQ